MAADLKVPVDPKTKKELETRMEELAKLNSAITKMVAESDKLAAQLKKAGAK